MPWFGAHMSAAGGLHKALEAASELGCDCLQLFTKSPNQWNAKALTDSEIRQFVELRKSKAFPGPLVAHDAYLTNLGSPEIGLWQKSIDAFANQLMRADRLGLDYLVMHPGAHMGSGESAGIARVAAGLDQAMEKVGAVSTTVLLESTAGQGTTLGWRLEHLRDIMSASKLGARLGICLDTCHVHAAGYPLESPENALDLLEKIELLVGLERLAVIHVNDSKKPAGSRADRHEHLGKGTVSKEAFTQLLSDLRLKNKSMILETPKENENGEPMDPTNLTLLKEFASARDPRLNDLGRIPQARQVGGHRSPTSRRPPIDKQRN